MAGSAWGETRLALRGTLLLARGDPRGLGCFDASLGGFWRSFRAGLVCYPFYFLLLFSRVTPAQWNAAGGFRIVAIETITFVISWTAFPLIMLRVCRWFGRDDHFFGFMVIYNWCQVPQFVLFTAIVLSDAAGLVSAGVTRAAGLIAAGAVLVYEWYVARLALDITAAAAILVVLIDLVLAAVLSQVGESLY
jgi:hypothetical protein